MIVVNFSTKEYSKGQNRLAASLKGYPHLMFNDYGQIDGPTHKQSPYQFKIHAIEKAWEKDPIVLWVDASMYLVGDLSRIERIIKDDGYFMEEAGHYVKTWCNDHTRNYFNLTDEESGFTMFSAGLLGLDRNNLAARTWFAEWKASANAGCFAGDWSNHRHDMTCGSIIAQRMGFKYQTGGTHLSYIGPGYNKPKNTTVFYCQGI